MYRLGQLANLLWQYSDMFCFTAFAVTEYIKMCFD